MICIARIFGAPDSVPAGSDARSASIALTSSRSVPDTEETMCMHVRVGLDDHQLVHGDRAVLAHPAEVVAAQVDQHHVLGALLLVGQQLLGRAPGPPRPWRRAAACRRSGAGLTRAALHLDQRLRRGAGDLEVLEVEEVHVRAGVDRRAARGRSRTPRPARRRSSAGWAPPGRRRRRGCTPCTAPPPRRSPRSRGSLRERGRLGRRSRVHPRHRAPPGARAPRRSPPRPRRSASSSVVRGEHVGEHVTSWRRWSKATSTSATISARSGMPSSSGLRLPHASARSVRTRS